MHRTSIMCANGKVRERSKKAKLTCNIMNIIDAMINSTKGVTSNDRFDDEFRKVNFPFIPTYHYHHGSRLLLHLLCYRFLCCFLLLLFHSPFPAEMSLQLFVYALQIYLVRPNKPNSFSITTINIEVF